MTSDEGRACFPMHGYSFAYCPTCNMEVGLKGVEKGQKVICANCLTEFEPFMW